MMGSIAAEFHRYESGKHVKSDVLIVDFVGNGTEDNRDVEAVYIENGKIKAHSLWAQRPDGRYEYAFRKPRL